MIRLMRSAASNEKALAGCSCEGFCFSRQRQRLRQLTAQGGEEQLGLQAFALDLSGNLGSQIRIDRESGMATARNARLEFKGVPILYTPWITYPVTNERMSGFLLPAIGRSETRGVEFQIHFNSKVKLETVVSDAMVKPAIDAIIAAANTGTIGDGKIFVTNVEEVVRIRTGETGETAL